VTAPLFTEFCTLGAGLSLGQRVFARIAYDGANPADLQGEERDRARELFGPHLDTIPPGARSIIVQLKGRDVGGTRLGAERGVHLAVTAPLDRVSRGELAYCLLGGPKLRHAATGLRFPREAARQRGIRVTDDTADGFTVIRPDGHRVRFECFAASRGGDNARGIPILYVLMTEAAFYLDESTGVVNAEDIFAAVVPRLLPHGQIVLESTPWAESGLLHAEFTRNHGDPSTALAAFCPTGLMRDDPETHAMIARERERDAENAARELDAQFMPIGSGHYFDAFAVKRCAVDTLPLLLPGPHRGYEIVAGYDPAYIRDACEGIIARVRPDKSIEVVELFTRVPAKNQPLVPSQVDREFARRVKAHGGRHIATDQHYKEAVREHVSSVCQLHDVPGGNAGKCEVFAYARERIHGGQVVWSEGHRRLTRQVSEIVAKPLAGGLMSISSPRRRGDHGDAAHALALALWASQFGDVKANRERRHRYFLYQLSKDPSYLWEGDLKDDREWNDADKVIRAYADKQKAEKASQ
jgi:hypothetical protein